MPPMPRPVARWERDLADMMAGSTWVILRQVREDARRLRGTRGAKAA